MEIPDYFRIRLFLAKNIDVKKKPTIIFNKGKLIMNKEEIYVYRYLWNKQKRFFHEDNHPLNYKFSFAKFEIFYKPQICQQFVGSGQSFIIIQKKHQQV